MPDFNTMLADIGLSEVEPAQLTTFSMLLHGMAGTGKTSLAATASKVEALSPVLIVDTENGTLPVAEWGDLNNATIVRINSWEEMQKLYGLFEKQLSTGDFPFKTVVFDTIDRLQELIVQYGARAYPNDGFKKWEMAYSALNHVLTTLLDAPTVNVIAITHTAREANQVTGEVLVSPDFEGQKSSKKLPSMFDFVGYMSWQEDPEDEDEVIPVLTTRDRGVVSKARIRDFPPDIGNPSMEKVYTYIRQAVDTTDED